MSESNKNQAQTRREFLRNAAATAAVSVAATNVAKSSVYSLAPSSVIGANERILLAHVGIGGQGGAHVKLTHENQGPGDKSLNNNTKSTAVCDLYVRRQKEKAHILELPDSVMFGDHRKMLDTIKDIDAVFVATSDNWHAQVVLDSLNAGKHVYCEKPMCKTLEEAFAIHDTVKKTKRVLQVGSQGCSDPKYHAAAKYVKEGKLGKLIQVQGSYNRNGKEGEWNYYEIDKDAGPQASGDAYVNWEVFRKGKGPVEWDPDRFFRWRKFWDYGSGLVGDLLPHRLHPLYIASALPTEGTLGFPIRVSSLGGLYVQKINPVTGKPDRTVPDFINVCADFDDGPSLMVMSSCVNETGWPDMIRGNKATMTIGGDIVEVKPERVWAEDVDAAREQFPGGEPIEKHERNFFDAIRGVVAKTNCNIDLAVRVQTIISLGEMSFRSGKMMHFDPVTRTATG